MRKLLLLTTLAAGTALAGCAYDGPAPMAATAVAANANAVCGGTTYVDANNDGWITGDEWNGYRSASYGYWDTNSDGRISQSEFQNCWYGNGFYREAYYNRDYWSPYWTAFDTNADGYLSADEYWSANAFTRMDLNANGRIDSNEWVWWR